MRLAGGFVFLLFLFFSAAGEPCRRRCGGLVVPYPLGFSGSCPIMLSCAVDDADGGKSTAALMIGDGGSNATSSSDSSYSVVSFNQTASTFVVSLRPRCDRTVSGARRRLSGANYGVTSSTGMFLRGGCHGGGGATTAACIVPAEVMSTMLRTVQCPAGENSSSPALTCVASMPPNATAAEKGVGLYFERWGEVEEPQCDNLLTSAFYGVTPDGVFSLELAMAEMGWWLNGSCTAGDGGRCAANATCHDVQTPTGGWGHQCRCHAGMDGDGFAAGDGCHFPGAGESSSSL
uniref:Wall-associated receptor kinase galacturonan-binding domain-containing protein n=1 Tax=Leersia perrieri TaxID=77586 RepID=A0A0D9Y132_9ORYZ